MRGLPGRLEHRRQRLRRRQFGQRIAQGAQQLMFHFNHRSILRFDCLHPACKREGWAAFAPLFTAAGCEER